MRILRFIRGLLLPASFPYTSPAKSMPLGPGPANADRTVFLRGPVASASSRSPKETAASRPRRLFPRLPLEHRIWWLGADCRIRVSMNDLPGARLRSKDCRDANVSRNELVAASYLGLGALHFHEIRKLRSDRLRDRLEADDLTVAKSGCGPIQPLFHLGPSSCHAPEWICEGDVLALRVHRFVAARITVDDCPQCPVILLDHGIEVISGTHLDVLQFSGTRLRSSPPSSLIPTPPPLLQVLRHFSRLAALFHDPKVAVPLHDHLSTGGNVPRRHREGVRP